MRCGFEPASTSGFIAGKPAPKETVAFLKYLIYTHSLVGAGGTPSYCPRCAKTHHPSRLRTKLEPPAGMGLQQRIGQHGAAAFLTHWPAFCFSQASCHS